MKLAEALQERADLSRRLEQLQARMNLNALVQEGETTPEDPDELLKEFEKDAARLQEVIAAINLRNAQTVCDGRTLTEMLAERDVLTIRIRTLQDLVSHASGTAHRARNSEIRILPSVNVRELQKQADRLAQQLRRLDNTIQELNWLTEL